MSIGMKHDTNKPDYSLVPYGALDEIVKVLTYGATKYDRDNWQYVSDVRYQAAVMRHFSAYMQGEKNDPETDLSHLAHMACSVLFLLQKELNKKPNDSEVTRELLNETIKNKLYNESFYRDNSYLP